MTPEWKALVREQMRERDLDDAGLARLIGCDKSLIARMLGPAQYTSRLVDAACRVLDVPPPTVPTPDGDELDELIDGATPAERNALLSVARATLEALRKR